MGFWLSSCCVLDFPLLWFKKSMSPTRFNNNNNNNINNNNNNIMIVCVKGAILGVWNFKSLKKGHEPVLWVARRTKKLGNLIVRQGRKGAHVGKFKDISWLTFFSFLCCTSPRSFTKLLAPAFLLCPFCAHRFQPFPLLFGTKLRYYQPRPMRTSRCQPAPLAFPLMPCITVAVYSGFVVFKNLSHQCISTCTSGWWR